jgi:hypothetical protein
MDENEKKLLILFIILNLFAYIIPHIWYIDLAGKAQGSDANKHLKIVNGWLDGDNPLKDEDYFIGNPFPYPPAFHLSIAAISKITQFGPNSIFNFLQIFLFSFILGSTFFLVSKLKNMYVGVLTTCLLISSIAFFDRSSQVIPNGIDAFLIPLIIYSFLKGKSKGFILLGAFIVYNHLHYGALLLFPMLVYSAKYDQKKLRDFGAVALLCIPLFIFYLPYFMNFSEFTQSYETRILQYQIATQLPLFNIAYLGYFLGIIAFLSLAHLLSRETTDFEKLLLLWVGSLIPLYIIFPHRAIPYLAHPIAIMGGITLDDMARSNKQKVLVLAVVLIIAAGYILAAYNTIGFLRSPITDQANYILLRSCEIIQP